MELSNNALLHLLYEEFVAKDSKKIEEIINLNKSSSNQKSDDFNRLNFVVSNYAVNRNVNNFFIKLDKKLNRLDEKFIQSEEPNTSGQKLVNNENSYTLMYNYATISKAANRLQTIFNIKNKGFNSSDEYDYDYSKIKLAIMLFEISFYYQNFEGTSV